MEWKDEIEEFKEYLKLQRGLSENSISAYVKDLQKVIDFLEKNNNPITPDKVTIRDLRAAMEVQAQAGISPRTQARIISGIKSFFKYLMIEEKIERDPTLQLQAPKIGRKLPEVLSSEEINEIIDSIDVNKTEGQRNRAIVLMLYSCGLRVSELVELRISQLVFDEGYIRVLGKGDKERLVPIGKRAIEETKKYLEIRSNMHNIHSKDADIVFLNRLGSKLSRVMVFNIIKMAADEAGILKTVSPHTFRHSFASHLINAGADLRSVQEMLGHESIVTTEIYTHLNTSHLKETIFKHPGNKDF
ncbi:MAG: site-specific tyrosine recombinase XerD [Bacteroidales bacterium]|nr:site-specific tyrosine recombinase XerD [Bacteroidales bacterium]